VTVRFKDVKNILDSIVADWTTKNGGAPDLTGRHGANFLWNTRDHLINATTKQHAPQGNPIQLIQPEIVGKPGLGHTANLVTALTAPSGVADFGQMPDGGLSSPSFQSLYLSLASPEIQTIVAWIEGGCKADP